MHDFTMNGIGWKIEIVPEDDRNLMDRTGFLTVATTDPNTYTVFLSDQLRGDFLLTVFVHELAHCTMVSFDMLTRIRAMTKPEHWIDMEEFICNFIADHGMMIYGIAFDYMGADALKMIPKAFDFLYPLI